VSQQPRPAHRVQVEFFFFSLNGDDARFGRAVWVNFPNAPWMSVNHSYQPPAFRK
jgi:hypothetical protein